MYKLTKLSMARYKNTVFFRIKNDTRKAGKLVQGEKIRFYHVFCLSLCQSILGFVRRWERQPLKTLWVKDKILVTSIFSFSHNVFCSLAPMLNESSASVDVFNFKVCNICSLGMG